MRVRPLLIVAVIMCASLARAEDWTLPHLDKSVLRLEVSTDDGKAYTCSSVVFAEGYALSAAHCLQGTGVELTINGRHGTVERSNRLLDLAVVKFVARADVVVAFRSGAVNTGEEIAAVGFQFGKRDLGVQVGHVAVPEDENGHLVLNIDVIPGDSGGPVLDRKGRLVGVLSAIEYAGPAHQAVAVPLDTVRDFVSDLLPAPKVAAKP